MNFSIQGVYNWYRDTIRNPKYRWWIILGSLLYLFSPIDIAPDFIPVIGWIDDTVILTLLIGEVSQMLTSRLKSASQSDSKTSESGEASDYTNNAYTNNASATGSSTVDVDAVSVK
ncbi:MAG: DUF1232 domain-containing protein [Trichocoleus desertorum ATA4-8-CV12]|nr:DUF1232 domain-containing protein [Trichocoleus desertorum ATA4-8-CV12]